MQYANGDGNDTVKGWNNGNTLYITGGSYTRSTVGSDVFIKVGSGSIKIEQGKYKTINIKGTQTSKTTTTAKTTTTTKSATSTSATATAKNIDNNTSGKTLTGTSYADTIRNGASGSKVTISAGAGNDTVKNWGDTVKVDAGAGNDSIYSYSYYGTITGGTGNDTVSLNSNGHHNVIQYASGDGNDKIFNLGAKDTLSITGGSYSYKVSGDNFVNV